MYSGSFFFSFPPAFFNRSFARVIFAGRFSSASVFGESRFATAGAARSARAEGPDAVGRGFSTTEWAGSVEAEGVTAFGLRRWMGPQLE